MPFHTFHSNPAPSRAASPGSMRRKCRMRGITLVEALVACLALSLGLLALSKVQGQLRLSGETARQRSEAVRLGEEDIEHLRAFASIAASDVARSYADVVPATRTIGTATGYSSNTVYVLNRQVAVSNVPSARNVTLVVSWPDRAGTNQRITLASVIAANDPMLSGALGLAPYAVPVNGPQSRSILIPSTAIKLGDGHSVWKPAGTGSVAFRFDDASGLVTDRCRISDPTLATAALVASDLLDCKRVTAYLLTGTIRFTSATPPDPAGAGDLPLGGQVAITSTGGPYPAASECSSATVAMFSDRYLAYDCVVYPLANGSWSGLTQLQPSGWMIDNRAADRRICRYADAYGSADTGDPSASALARYSAIKSSVANQNFLVIRGDQTCPG